MSAYGTDGRYPDHAELERHGVESRLEVARMMVERYRREGDATRMQRWQRTCNALLDRLLDVRGR